MKKLLTIMLLLSGLVISVNVSAQLSVLGSDEYGQIFDVSYHPHQENVLFARTLTNHIIKSEDHGGSWEIIYSYPLPHYATLNTLRVINNGTALSFVVSAQGTEFNSLTIFDIATETITREIFPPNSNQNDILIASYAIDEENNDNIVLHTTYFQGFGFKNEVFYTSNGGNEWNQIYFSDDHDQVGVNNVALQPGNPQKVFLMRAESPGSILGGLYVSEDSGATWTEKIPGHTYSPIAFNPENPDDIFVGTFMGSGTHEQNLYRSLDGGETWTIIPITWESMSANVINYIAFNPLNTDRIIVLEENEIAVSEDNGVSWNNYVYPEIDPEDYYYGLYASFNPFRESEILISANFYPFYSQDGGASVTKFKSNFINAIGSVTTFGSQEENHIYYGLRGGFIHRDLETGIETPNGLLPLNQFSNLTRSGLYTDKQVPGRVFWSTTNFMGNSSVIISPDHGTSLYFFSASFPVHIVNTETSQSNPNIVWLSSIYYGFKVDLTDLDNIVHEELSLPEEGYFYGISIHPQDQNDVIITQGVHVYHSADGGSTWESIGSGLESLVQNSDIIWDLARNPFNPNELAIATTKGIFKSEDQGVTWFQVYEGSNVNTIAFSTENDGKIVAAAHFYDGDEAPYTLARILYSEDHGINWTDISPETLEYLVTESSDFLFGENYADVYFNVHDLGLVGYHIDFTTLTVNPIEGIQSSLTIYPNPAADEVNILSENKINFVTVYDMSGRQVLQAQAKTIYLSGLPKGIYLVKVELENGKTEVRKLIKK